MCIKWKGVSEIRNFYSLIKSIKWFIIKCSKQQKKLFFLSKQKIMLQSSWLCHCKLRQTFTISIFIQLLWFAPFALVLYYCLLARCTNIFSTDNIKRLRSEPYIVSSLSFFHNRKTHILWLWRRIFDLISVQTKLFDCGSVISPANGYFKRID